MILTRVIFKQDPNKAAKDYAADIAATTKEIESCSLEVTNQNLYGTALKNIPDLIARGVVVTRLLRDEKISTPTSETILQEGDKIHIVGSIPIALPGMPTPLKLGLAGGPLIVAIVLSRKRKIGPLNFFMANSANLMLREFGLTLFLSCVGLNAGIKFFDVLLNGDGLHYMAHAALITFIPLAIVAVVGHLVFKVNYLSLCGVLAGATTDPPALAFANGQTDSEAVNIGYASVYPLTMLLRILSGQVLAILLLQAL